MYQEALDIESANTHPTPTCPSSYEASFNAEPVVPAILRLISPINRALRLLESLVEVLIALPLRLNHCKKISQFPTINVFEKNTSISITIKKLPRYLVNIDKIRLLSVGLGTVYLPPVSKSPIIGISLRGFPD
jgi:hypothetical protein